MAKLHFVKRAAKTYRGTGIKKGQMYWWWQKMRPRGAGPKVRGTIFRSPVKPPRSAYATTSPFLGAMMDLEDRFPNCESASDVEEIATEVRALGDDCQEKIDSVSQSFRNGCPTADLLQSRIDSCNSIADELDRIASEVDEILSNGENDPEKAVDSVEELLGSISWEYE